jgi:hypothetical protein
MSESVKQTIFNSLAITFLLDLNVFYWEVCSTIFHLSPKDLTEFRIPAPDPGLWTQGEGGVRLAEGYQNLVCCPGSLAWIANTCKFLRRGFGAKQAESLLARALLSLLLARQVFVVLFAFETNVTPVVRDVCTHFHIMEAYPVMKTLVEWSTWAPIDSLVNETVSKSITREGCGYVNSTFWDANAKYHRVRMGDMLGILADYPVRVCTFLGIIFILLVVPHVFQVTRSFLLRRDLHLDKDLEQKRKTNLLEKAIARVEVLESTMDSRVAELEKKIESQAEEMQDLRRALNDRRSGASVGL